MLVQTQDINECLCRIEITATGMELRNEGDKNVCGIHKTKAMHLYRALAIHIQ